MSETEVTPEVEPETQPDPQISDDRPHVEDVSNSTTGFEEQAVKKVFKTPLGTLANSDQFQYLRALVFILRKRDGANDATAYNAAQSMTMTDVLAEFADEEQAQDPDELVELGKDD